MFMHILCEVNEQDKTDLPIGGSGFKLWGTKQVTLARISFVISGSRHDVTEICDLLEYYASYISN
jgi:hypothetical protein